jgi:hypothetical protein
MASKPPFDAYFGAVPVQAAIPRAWFYVLILAAVAGFYVWEARYLYLDDAFIHLRIAKNLLDHGFYSFNGDLPAYCTSSPLYTALVALCYHVLSTPTLPKIMGVLIYAVLFALLASRVAATVTPRARWLSITFLAAVASPLAMRWLADGMETGLAGIFALLLARAAFEIYSESKPAGAPALAGYAFLGLLSSMLRIEFALLVALIGAAALTGVRLRGIDPRAIALGLGSAAGFAVIYGIFGRILPDTAIAKAHVIADMSRSAAALTTVRDIAKAHAAASSLGVIVVIGMLGSFVAAMRTARRGYFVGVLNAGFALLLVLIVWRQQAIQGYRYFVFIEFFLFAFNVAVLNVSKEPRDRPAIQARPWDGFKSPFAAALLGVVFVGWQAFDLYKLRTISAGRAVSFETFQSTDFTDLKGTNGIAFDVGMIGYFSQATILDGSGLVNGLEVARMTRDDRLHLFATAYPVRFFYVNEPQLAALREFLNVSRWAVRATFDFPNFAGDPDRHFLMVRQDSRVMPQ